MSYESRHGGLARAWPPALSARAAAAQRRRPDRAIEASAPPRWFRWALLGGWAGASLAGAMIAAEL